MIESKHGVVVLVDILGVSAMDVEQCKELIRVKLDAIQSMKSSVIYKFFIDSPDANTGIYQFGDSILICHECEAVGEEAFNQLSALAVAMKRLILHGVKMGLLIRGAISFGDYIEDIGLGNATVIGPAVADVASWYEEAQWAGIIATPKAGQVINSRYFREEKKGGLYSIYNAFVHYEVPLRSSKRKMWAVSWPHELRSSTGESTDQLRQNILADLAKFNSIPKGTEEKYSNTLEFIEYCWREGWARTESLEPSQ